MDKIQALNNFWSSFGLPAYDVNSVPSDASYPYITYEVSLSDFDHDIPLTASIWYKGTSWLGATQKEAEISSYIGRGGLIVPYEGGAFWLRKATPFAQRIGDDTNDQIKRYILQLSIEYMD